MASPGGSDNQDGGEEIPPNATVYVRNINEKVKIPTVIDSLRGLFSTYGEVKDIIAKKSLKRKGQAFVVFEDVDSAQNAIDDLIGFELFGQQLNLEFAKTRSDITVLKEDGEKALEAHKQQRLAEKERKQAEAAAAAEKVSKKRAAEADDENVKPAKMQKFSGGASRDVPDEYLPPNKTLMLRELPGEAADVDAIRTAFGAFEGFREVRSVPGRPVAFVEFESPELAAVAKQATTGLQFEGKAARITFRR